MVTMRPQLAAAHLYAARMRRAPAAWLLSMVVGVAALAPSASAAQINPAVQLQALSCASSGNCSAVGGYDDGLGNSQALLVTESPAMAERGQAQPRRALRRIRSRSPTARAWSGDLVSGGRRLQCRGPLHGRQAD